MNKIIQDTITELTRQRSRLVTDISELNENTMNYNMKEGSLKAMVFDIDNQINNLLNRVIIEN